MKQSPNRSMITKGSTSSGMNWVTSSGRPPRFKVVIAIRFLKIQDSLRVREIPDRQWKEKSNSCGSDRSFRLGL